MAVGVLGDCIKEPAMKLCEQLSDRNLWAVLEQAAIQIVTNGGMASMGYYRDAWHQQRNLSEDGANPSTIADVQATAAILQSCHTLLSPIAGGLGCGISYLAEESHYDDLLGRTLSDEIMKHKHTPERFFGTSRNIIRAIFDGIDGTANFNRGMPLFCTGLALLVDEEVRVSAIYDPIHHLVYSAVLSGPYAQPEALASASAWPVSSGNRIDLIAESRRRPPLPLNKEAIGTHFTRSNPELLRQFLQPREGEDQSAFELLVARTGGVYALNSGLLAMAEVARGALGGFLNLVTNPWDVAAGECLVRACGGVVTSTIGSPLSYLSPAKISVLAAKPHLHGDLLDIARGLPTP